MVSVQSPVRFAGRSLPEPDIVLIWPEASRDSHPTEVNILLVVAVAASSLTDDRDVKALLYARADIPEYWLVDLTADRIEICTVPSDQGYATTHRAGRGQRITASAVEGLTVATGQLLD